MYRNHEHYPDPTAGRALVAPLSSAPSVISELKNGSAWYVPGGKSTSARI